MTIEVNSMIYHKLTGEPMFVLEVREATVLVRHYQPRTGLYVEETFTHPEFELTDPNSPEKILNDLFRKQGAEEITFAEPNDTSIIKPA